MGTVPELKKVLATVDYSPEHWDRLASALAPAETFRCSWHSEAIADVDAAILGGDITFEELQAAKRIRWIHCDHAGPDNSAHPDVFKRGILLTSSSGRSAPVLAEHAFFLMLSLIYGSSVINEPPQSRALRYPKRCFIRIGGSFDRKFIIPSGLIPMVQYL